jgi:predicted methyltransferase
MNEWCKIYKNECLLKNKKFIRNYKELLKGRPDEKKEYFQGHASLESVICRICAISHKENLSNKKIIIFGDDDLISLGLSIYCKNCDITVIDIDKDLLKYINNFFPNIRCIYHDIYSPLPQSLVKNFDIFITDPYENISYIKACIDRGIESIKHNGVGYMGFPNREVFIKNCWREIQRYCLDNGLLITDLIFSFNKYPSWSESAFVRLIKI